eukprot:30195_2
MCSGCELWKYKFGGSQHTWLGEFRRIFIHQHHCVITTLRMLVAAVCSAAACVIMNLFFF